MNTNYADAFYNDLSNNTYPYLIVLRLRPQRLLAMAHAFLRDLQLRMQIPDLGLQLFNTRVEPSGFVISDVEFLDDSCVLLLGGVQFGLEAEDDLVAVVYLLCGREGEDD